MIETTQQRIIALEKRIGSDAKSPLFAQLAHYYLEINRAQDALRLCDAGLAHFPFYTTGHLIKGKALVALQMRAEARREFELVLDLLPNNEAVLTLLAQIPPSEEETLTVPLQEVQPEIHEPEQVPPSLEEYRIPSAPQLTPEPGYSFGEIEQPALEQQPEPPSSPEPSSGSTFFDAITQAPVASVTEDPFGFGSSAPAIETPVAPEPSSFSGFEVTSPPTEITKIPTSSTERPSGFEFTLSAPDLNIPLPSAPVEEESFENYAARRRVELSGEDTISLEDYLNNAMLVLPQTPELAFPLSVDIPNKVEEFPTKPLIDLPQILQPETPISADVQNTIEELPSSVSIVLPEAPPPEPPSSTDEQNNIEELANKLKTAGKITPVINIAQRETPAASEPETSTGVGFVTPTLAEIYAKQGWFDDAIKAYRTLVRNKPAEKERYEKRIAELEQQKKQSN